MARPAIQSLDHGPRSMTSVRLTSLLVAIAAMSFLAACSDDSSTTECTGADCDGPDRRIGKGDAFGEGALPFSTDQRFVLRQRLDLAESGTETVVGTPFSHAGRKWHVYPIALYKGGEIAIDLTTQDPDMSGRATVFLYGPLQSDGTWPEVARGVTDIDKGTVSVVGEVPGFGQYAVVIGPETSKGFLPRYPGTGAYLYNDDEDLHVEFQISSDGTATATDDDGNVYDVVEPKPGVAPDEDPAIGELFVLRDADGKEIGYALENWDRAQWLVPDDGTDEDLYLAQVAGDADSLDVSYINDLGNVNNYWVLSQTDGVGDPTDNDPHFYTLVPFELDNGDFTHVIYDENCQELICYDVLLSDGTPVDDSLISYWKALHYDVYETSVYDFTVTFSEPVETAEGGLRVARQAQTKAVTKYPIYFAHGFNSSAEVWTTVFDRLEEHDGAWAGWVDAKDVPGFEPVPNRAEHLRRNVQQFVDTHEPAAGEPFVRVNIVAHSMGGLDSRYLIGSEKYNERCLELLCEDAEGNPEACCTTDDNGDPVYWRNRVASVTTLSTPHCGSSFASWGVELLTSDNLSRTFRWIAGKVLGFEGEQYDLLLDTLYALSKEFCADVMEPDYPAPISDRVYDWECATGKRDCAMPEVAAQHLPKKEVGSRDNWILPGPTDQTTIFSWGSYSCVNGSCGSLLDPTLIAPWKVVRDREGRNDGVVALDSSVFGIYMGVRSNDHFRWNRIGGDSTVRGWVRSLFGVKREPADRFHKFWLGELVKAGY